MALYCPDPANHHHPAPPHPPAQEQPDLGGLLIAEFKAGNYSIRGLAARYIALGASRSYVRGMLWKYDPDYMRDEDRRHGPRRYTIRDHAANRARRRKYIRWVESDEWLYHG